MKRFNGHGFITLLCIAASIGPAWADNPPTGYSQVPYLFIAERKPPDFPREQMVLIESAEVIEVCKRKGKLWFKNYPHPLTCSSFVRDENNGLLRLRLDPAPPPARLGATTFTDLQLGSTRPFPPARWKQAPASDTEVAALRREYAAKLGTSGSAGIKSVDTGVGPRYLFAPGKRVLDADESLECATISTRVFVYQGQSITYVGELQAPPAGFVDSGNKAPPLIEVSTQCGRVRSVWRVLPKLQQVMDYSDGYEYGE